MLYNKIRYAKTIRGLYKLRHLLEYERHPDIGSRLGYAKYSKQYYSVREKLKKENILDREGKFIDSITNKWIVELPAIIKNEKEFQVLGFPSTYNVYLALFFNKTSTFKSIRSELEMSERTAYAAIKKLTDYFLIKNEYSIISINKKSEFYNWFSKYLDLCIMQADTDDKISILFDFVPAYVDGLQAYYITNYEPGRPVGPSDMIIRTNTPYEYFWNYAIRQVRYFMKFPKRIIILPRTNDAKIILLNGIPYNKNATENFNW